MLLWALVQRGKASHVKRTVRQVDPTPALAVPPGAPAWVTAELLAHTLAAWQPYYAAPLTATDALEILLNVGQLIDALGTAEHEKVRGASAGIESRTGTRRL